MPPVAREAEGGDDEAARDGAFWRPQNPELSRPRPAHTRSDPPTLLTAPSSIFLEPLVARSPVVPPQWRPDCWRLATLLQTLCCPSPPASPSFSRLPPLRRPTAAKSRLLVRGRRTCGPVSVVHTLRAVYLSSLVPGLDLNLAELSASPVASYGNAVPYSTRGELQYLLATRRSAGKLVGFEPVLGARVYTRA